TDPAPVDLTEDENVPDEHFFAVNTDELPGPDARPRPPGKSYLGLELGGGGGWAVESRKEQLGGGGGGWAVVKVKESMGEDEIGFIES
nr:hypothetical protein [Tanacetum cinerariifolium]